MVRLHEAPHLYTRECSSGNEGGQFMEFVAQLVERQVVALVVVGSIPIKLPNAFNSTVVMLFTCNEQVVG